MICVKLFGGLGNQLFQYAAARQLADTHHTDLFFDLTWFKSPPLGNTKRDFELSNYNIKFHTLNGIDKFLCRLYGIRGLNKLPVLPKKFHLYKEAGFNFEPVFFDLPDSSYLDGYFQSFKYFELIADQIRNELSPVTDYGKLDLEVKSKIESVESVSIHVRRGDYVTSKASMKTLGVCDLDYYDRAINEIVRRLGDPHFFIFSDDPEWSKENLKVPGSVTYVSHNSGPTAFQDIRLMSICNHHIIANSTFSWWGAWLNSSKEKIVITPKKWFSNGMSSKTLIPENWLQV